MKPQQLKIKRGDTFCIILRFEDPVTAEPLILPVSAIRGQVRQNDDALLCDLIITALTAPGEYSAQAPTTTNWPVNSVVLMDADWVFDVKDSAWKDEPNVLNGRYIYAFRADNSVANHVNISV